MVFRCRTLRAKPAAPPGKGANHTGTRRPVHLSAASKPLQPLLSVIVPRYNHGRYLRATLRSILDQAYRPLEVIVVDGASKDETLDVLKSFEGTPELRWISEKDRGPADAVNKGLAMAKGELIGIQSADDIY